MAYPKKKLLTLMRLIEHYIFVIFEKKNDSFLRKACRPLLQGLPESVLYNSNVVTSRSILTSYRRIFILFVYSNVA